MKPLIILTGVFIISALLTRYFTGSWNLLFSGNLALCLMLCFTALGHFLFPTGMALMIPPAIPFRKELVYVTGVGEVVLGIALLSPALRPYAGYALLILFVLMFPANVYAAMKHLDLEKGTYTGPGLSYLWFRVPLQILFIGWVYYFSIRH